MPEKPIAEKFNMKKFITLKKRIASGKYWVPQVGQYVYTETRISCDHGWDDVLGGLSTVSKVYTSMSGGDKDCVFIEITQHDRGGNWTQFLYPEQTELMKRFGRAFSRPDPDYSPDGNQYDPQEWH